MGLSNGQRVGQTGQNTEASNGMASGWEADTRAGALVHTPPGCGDPPSSPIPLDTTAPPTGDVLLARADSALAEINGQLVTVDGAEMRYYEHAAGGFVLSTGSITFIGSLITDSKLQQIIGGALIEAAIRGEQP